MQTSVKNLIIDSGAIIKGTHLHLIGDNLLTTPDVLREIKDRQSRSQLVTLPSELKIRNPSDSSIDLVVNFTKSSGDFSGLSVTDIRVLALTVDIEREERGSIDHLNTVPFSTQEMSGGKYSSDRDKIKLNPDGWYSPPQSPKKDAVSVEEKLAQITLTGRSADKTDKLIEEEDNNGWITPKNVKKIRHKAFQAKLSSENELNHNEKMEVACITTDFAMQNTILQMNMNLLSLEGLRISTLKTFVLRCHACFQVTKNMEKRFCPSCGNPTLIKTTTSIDPLTGKIIYHLKKNFRYNIRGTKFSLPEPKGGRQQEIILREDQKEFQRALKKENREKQKNLKFTESLGDGTWFLDSPDGLTANSSRRSGGSLKGANQHGGLVIGCGKRNPNAVGRK